MNTSAQPLRPLSLSILGVEPTDEFILEIADWVHSLVISRPAGLDGQIEVEAKLGVLKYKDSNARIMPPVKVETILSDTDHRFESNMTTSQHRHFNELLNNLEATSRQAGHRASPLSHQHTYLVDNFYTDPDTKEKIRVTRDEKSGEVKEIIRKVRLGNLDVYSPKRQVDWRLSVNMEVRAPHPVGTPNLSRRKDRMSYSHEEFVVDLTQVQQTIPGNPPQLMHELEVEFARPELVLSTASMRHDQSLPLHEREAFDELVRAFVNNVRILARNALPL